MKLSRRDVVQKEEQGLTLGVGSYELKFSPIRHSWQSV